MALLLCTTSLTTHCHVEMQLQTSVRVWMCEQRGESVAASTKIKTPLHGLCEQSRQINALQSHTVNIRSGGKQRCLWLLWNHHFALRIMFESQDKHKAELERNWQLVLLLGDISRHLKGSFVCSWLENITVKKLLQIQVSFTHIAKYLQSQISLGGSFPSFSQLEM